MAAIIINYKPSFLTIFFLLLFFIIHTASAIVLFPVRDTNGDPVKAGIIRYRILSVLPDHPGLVIHEQIQGNCPEAVTLFKYGIQGFSIGFFPNNTNGVEDEVMVSERINLQFSTPSSCNEVSGAWKAGRRDDVANGVIEYLWIGGKMDEYSFRIEEVEPLVVGTHYKLLYCSPECVDCMCNYVGIHDKDGVQRLALFSIFDDAKPFEFKIEKMSWDSN